MHVVGILYVTQSFFNNIAFRHVKSLQNDPVIFRIDVLADFLFEKTMPNKQSLENV